MGSEASLLEAIYAAPERDEPRLVYADWLQEHQNPRGELIHLQVAQARVLAPSAEYHRLAERSWELLKANGEAWTPRLARELCSWTFKRGFPSAVQTSVTTFVPAIDEFFAQAPLLDEVQLDFGPLEPMSMASVSWLDRLCSAEAFGRLKTLRLRALNDTGAVALAGMKRLSSLRSLVLSGFGFGTGTYEMLGSSGSQLLQLQGLGLWTANARDVGLERLFAHPWPSLEALEIGTDAVAERGIRALTRPGRLPSLKKLALPWSFKGGVPAMEALASCQSLQGLEELDLGFCAVSDAMAEVLATAKGFNLRVFRLSHSELTLRGVSALLSADCLSQVKLLELSGRPFDEATIERLIGRFGDRVRFTPISA